MQYEVQAALIFSIIAQYIITVSTKANSRATGISPEEITRKDNLPRR